MDELLKKLLEAEVLSEETKTELEAAFKKQLDETLEAARAKATIEVTAQLEEQWIQEREVLIEALDAKVTEVLADEMKELKEDIERFRDLEAEYAEKLVEAKVEMASQLKEDMDVLLDKMDKFFEVRLTTEMEELREDIENVKRNDFGKKVFEAFAAEYEKFHTADDSAVSKLAEAERRLEETVAILESAEKKIARMERSSKMEQVLAPLSGRAREVMEAILKSVDTNMLEEAYKTYVGRVLKETTVVSESDTSEKETKVLAEGKKVKSVSGVTKTGDDKAKLDESVKLDQEVIPSISDEERARLRRLAGIA